MAKFAKILGLLGLGSDKEAVTEAHLEAADTKIAQLEQARTTAETNLATAQAGLDKATADLSTAQGALTEANGKLTEATGKLTAAEGKVATLEEWKKNQAAADGRTEDDSNNLEEEEQEGPKAAWEVAAANAVASVKKRLGEK